MMIKAITSTGYLNKFMTIELQFHGVSIKLNDGDMLNKTEVEQFANELRGIVAELDSWEPSE